MTLNHFKRVMKYERTAWDITENVTFYATGKIVEVYDFRTNQSKVYPSIDDAIEDTVDGKKIKDIIEETEDFPPLIFDSAACN